VCRLVSDANRNRIDPCRIGNFAALAQPYAMLGTVHLPGNEICRTDDCELGGEWRNRHSPSQARGVVDVIPNVVQMIPHPSRNGGDRNFLTVEKTLGMGLGPKLGACRADAGTGTAAEMATTRVIVRASVAGDSMSWHRVFGNPQDHITAVSWFKSNACRCGGERPHILFMRLFRPDSRHVAQREMWSCSRASVP